MKKLIPFLTILSLVSSLVLASGGGSNSASGGGGTWGSITGTLSDQTDLNTSLSAKGDFSGPASSTDGNVVTMNGAGGKTGRSETKFSVNATTGAVTQSFSGSPSGALHTVGMGTADTYTAGLRLNGALASAATTISPIEIATSRALSGSLGQWSIYNHPSFSSSSSGQFFGIYNLMQATSTASGQGAGNNNSVNGVTGQLNYGMNDSTSGTGAGSVNFSYGNKSIGVRGYAYSIGGSAPRAVGVLGTAGVDNSATSTGGYFVTCATGSGATCEGYTNAGVSAALVSDNKDASVPSFVAMNNGSSVMYVDNSGKTNIKSIVANSGSAGIAGTAACNGTTEVTVNTTKVTAASIIQLTEQATGGTPSGVVYVSSRNAGTSFGFKCAAADTSTVGWLIVEPSPL